MKAVNKWGAGGKYIKRQCRLSIQDRTHASGEYYNKRWASADYTDSTQVRTSLRYLCSETIRTSGQVIPWIPTKAPRHPINTAYQAPFVDVAECIAAPLNGVYCVGEAPPAVKALPKLPPVRLAPFGCDKKIKRRTTPRPRLSYPNRFCVVYVGTVGCRT